MLGIGTLFMSIFREEGFHGVYIYRKIRVCIYVGRQEESI